MKRTRIFSPERETKKGDFSKFQGEPTCWDTMSIALIHFILKDKKHLKNYSQSQ